MKRFCRQLVPRGWNGHRTTLLHLRNHRFLSLGDLCNFESRQIIQTLFIFLGGRGGWMGEEILLRVWFCFPMIFMASAGHLFPMVMFPVLQVCLFFSCDTNCCSGCSAVTLHALCCICKLIWKVAANQCFSRRKWGTTITAWTHNEMTRKETQG